MADELEPTAPDAPIDNPTPPVKDPAAVLAKNAELLAKLAAGKKDSEALTARLAEFERKEAEAERQKLEKKGDWEKIREAMEKSQAEKDAAKDARYDKLFENTSRYQLAVEIGKQKLAEGANPEQLAKLLLLDEIKSVEENGKIVWRKLDTDEEVKLHEFIPTLSDNPAYGIYLDSDINPGGDAPGNTGTTKPSGGKWSTMTTAERSQAIRQAGGDVDAAKRKYK